MAARKGARWVRLCWRRFRPPKSKGRRAPGNASLRSGTIRDQHAASAELDLEQTSVEPSLAALARALAHPDAAVRKTALAVVTEFSAQRAELLVSSLLRDPDPAVRCAAAGAAARMDGKRIGASLIVALEDPSPEVRRAAARAIHETVGTEVTISGPDCIADAREVTALRASWKQRRLAELIAEEE
jgi:HEAT repeat protein